MLIVEGRREHWEPKPIEVIKSSIRFIEKLNIHNIILASAFKVENIPY
jgi:hypothetical protein